MNIYTTLESAIANLNGPTKITLANVEPTSTTNEFQLSETRSEYWSDIRDWQSYGFTEPTDFDNVREIEITVRDGQGLNFFQFEDGSVMAIRFESCTQD